MLPVTKKELKALIKEARSAGVDVADLEARAKVAQDATAISQAKCYCRRKKGEYLYLSTGPARPDDFEGLE